MVEACAQPQVCQAPPYNARPAKLPACDRIPTHGSLWLCTPSDIWRACRSNGPTCSRVPWLGTSEHHRVVAKAFVQLLDCLKLHSMYPVRIAKEHYPR